MNYTNKQIAAQIAKIIDEVTTNDNTSSFQNGTISYNGQSYKLPSINSLKRKTYLNNR